MVNYNTILIKRGEGAPGALTSGQMALDTLGHNVWIGDPSGNQEVLMKNIYTANTFLYATSGEGPEVKTRAQGLGILSDQADAAFSMGGQRLTSLGAPEAETDAVTKLYADSLAAGVDIRGSVRLATAAPLPACTAAGSKVGKTLTMNAVGHLDVDGLPVALNNRIMVKNQVEPHDNGIYKVTTLGEDSTEEPVFAGVAAVLTRATDADEDDQATPGMFAFIEEGDVNADRGFLLVSDSPLTVDTTPQNFTQFSVAGQVTAGVNMSKVGETLNVYLNATDKILGRVSSGAGTSEEIDCTAFARSILDDVDGSAVRATIGAQVANADYMTLDDAQTVTGAKTFNVSTMVLAGSGSGTTVVNSAAVAASTVLTMPTGTATLLADNSVIDGGVW